MTCLASGGKLQKTGRGNVDWLFTITLNEPIRVSRDDVIDRLSKRGVETRPVFYPMHTLPPYREMGQEDGDFPVADRVARSGLSLPTWAGLQREDVVYVCDALRECIGDAKAAAPALSQVREVVSTLSWVCLQNRGAVATGLYSELRPGR